MKYWQLSEDMKLEFGPALYDLIQLNGGINNVSLDEYILVKVIGEDDYYWTYDLSWEA